MSNVCSFTFGGSNVQTNQFFAANGNVSSQTSNVDIGNAFVLPARMRIDGFSWNKSNANGGVFDLTMNNETVIQLDGVGSVNYTRVESDQIFEANSMIRLLARYTGGDTAFRSCLITLYFVLIRSNSDPLAGRYLIGIPFGGNVATETRSTLLRVGVDARTGLDANMNYIGTRFTVPAPMRLFRVGFQKTVSNYDTAIQFYKNGERLVICRLWRGSGLEDFPLADDSPSRQLEAGDVLQLAFERGIVPGICLITLYTTEGTWLGSESGEMER
jgi:hypothetical protein